MNPKINRYLNILLISTLVLSLGFLFAACNGTPSTQVPGQKMATPSMTLVTEEPQPASTLEGLITERMPVPTAHQGLIERELVDAVSSTDLAGASFLGLEISDWISLLLSLFYIVVSYILGSLLVKRSKENFIKRGPETLDRPTLEKIFSDIRWLIVALIAFLTSSRLSFLSDQIRLFLGDLYFLLLMFFLYRISRNIIELGNDWFRQTAIKDDREEELAPVITLVVRGSQIIIVIFGIINILSHFGVDVAGFMAVLGIGGLAISLAARDTIADAISGFIILLDRPFRMGDRIEIQEVGTWGDVVEIGLRTTRIRTRDNRMVIVPNSIMGSNQIINYSYPDPRYRIETHVGVAYGTDIEMVRKLIIDTVSSLDFVLLDKPIDALYIEMGNFAMIFRVRWWIDSYVDTRRVIDKVHTALQIALDEAGVESPFPTQSINMQFEPELTERFSQMFNESQKGKRKNTDT